MERKQLDAALNRLGITAWEPRRPLSGGPAPPAAAADVPPATKAVESAASAPTVATVPLAGADWASLEQAVADCDLCALHSGRNCSVFGVGDRNADWLFIGEGPGAEEDRRGEPFVGRAGKLLDSMLAALGLSRGDGGVYIANIVKCRPPENRDPRPEERDACLPYLRRQIELLRPAVIVVLGRVAAQALLQTETPMAKLRGREAVLPGSEIPLVATYHPAYLLRAPREKAKAWDDLRLARRIMRRLEQGG